MNDEARATIIRRLAQLYPQAAPGEVAELVHDAEQIVRGLAVGDIAFRTEQLARARLEARHG